MIGKIASFAVAFETAFEPLGLPTPNNECRARVSGLIQRRIRSATPDCFPVLPRPAPVTNRQAPAGAVSLHSIARPRRIPKWPALQWCLHGCSGIAPASRPHRDRPAQMPHQRMRTGMAFPDTRLHRFHVGKIREAIDTLDIVVFWESHDGTVRVSNQNRIDGR